jgi:hypothetical protein
MIGFDNGVPNNLPIYLVKYILVWNIIFLQFFACYKKIFDIFNMNEDINHFSSNSIHNINSFNVSWFTFTFVLKVFLIIDMSSFEANWHK